MAATFSSLVGVSLGGKYEIRRVLGAGGMGVVCEAVHVDLGKRVAIKLIDKSMKESELIVARFKREARALAQIKSEHIVEVFDVGADQRVGLYMVMEHLTGEDLQERLERDTKIDPRTAVMIGHQIARALAKAHAAGVVHRDLKPANVYLTKRDNGQMLVKLLDFGVSKVLDVPHDARITGQGSPIGTPLYMAPEQAEGKDDVDGRADIWSFGAVMYESLSGDSAFQDRGTYHNTLMGILTSRPKPLFEVAPWVPKALAEVVDAMLVHDRDKRIASAEAVTQRLLDAYPTVHPDGTGLHTAVIVPQNEGPADATIDTEVFTSTQVSAVQARPTGPPPKPQDSTTTLGDAFPPPPLASSSAKTMPFAPPSGASSGTPSSLSSTSSASISSVYPAKFSTLKITPSEMGALPSIPPPDAAKEPRRGGAVMASVLLGLVGVAIGGYLATHRASPNPPATATPQPVFTDITPPATIAPPLDVPSAAHSAAVPAPPNSVMPSSSAAPAASEKPRFRPVTKLKVRPTKTTEAPEPAPAPEPEPEPTGNPKSL